MKSVKDSTAVQGEGNYEVAKEYDESVRSFVTAGKVPLAVQKAKPTTVREAQQLQDAEREGLSHSKGEDPGVKSKAHRKP